MHKYVANYWTHRMHEAVVASGHIDCLTM